MKPQRVYIDTSVVGGCFDAEFAPWSNGLVQDFNLGHFIPVLSELVAAELEEAPLQVKQKYAEILALDAEVLSLTEAGLDLANLYQRRGILTENFFADGLHIALATIAEVDLMSSWNFRHIVHFDKIRMFNAVNLEMGYKTLQIYSPREVTYYGEE